MNQPNAMVDENFNYAYISCPTDSDKVTVDFRLNLRHDVDVTKYTCQLLNKTFTVFKWLK